MLRTYLRVRRGSAAPLAQREYLSSLGSAQERSPVRGGGRLDALGLSLPMGRAVIQLGVNPHWAGRPKGGGGRQSSPDASRASLPIGRAMRSAWPRIGRGDSSAVIARRSQGWLSLWEEPSAQRGPAGAGRRHFSSHRKTLSRVALAMGRAIRSAYSGCPAAPAARPLPRPRRAGGPLGGRLAVKSTP